MNAIPNTRPLFVKRCSWFVWIACLVLPNMSWAQDNGSEPNESVQDRIEFENHIQAVLSRSGCNMGACHGRSLAKVDFDSLYVGMIQRPTISTSLAKIAVAVSIYRIPLIRYC